MYLNVYSFEIVYRKMAFTDFICSCSFAMSHTIWCVLFAFYLETEQPKSHLQLGFLALTFFREKKKKRQQIKFVAPKAEHVYS